MPRPIRMSVVVAALVVSVVACGKTAALPTTGPSSGSRERVDAAAASLAPTTSGDAGASGSTSASASDAASAPGPPPPCLPLQWVKDACFVSERSFGKPVDDSNAWLTSRGANAKDRAMLQLGICREVAVGPDHEDALVCTYSFGTNAGVMPSGLEIVTVRKTRIAVLLKVLDVLGEMPIAPPAPTDPPTGPLFALQVDVSDPAHAIAFSLPKPDACTEAHVTIARGRASEPPAEPSIRPMIAAARRETDKYLTQICDGAKTYVWSNGIYRAK